MHVCSGTSSDYTVTLPAVASSAGKFVGIRIAPACTKLITVDGNSTELIDGAQTRVMWAHESAILYCDGVTWTKVAGKSIPMQAMQQRIGSSYQAMTGGYANNTLTYASTTYDIGGLAQTAKMTTWRAGYYDIRGNCGFKSDAPTSTRCIFGLSMAGTYIPFVEDPTTTSTGPFFRAAASTQYYLAAAADILAICQYSNAGTTNMEQATLAVREILSW